jgi:hypothetical protein
MLSAKRRFAFKQASLFSFRNVHKHQKIDGRDENVHTEEATDPIGEKLLEKQPEIQTVFAEEWDKLGVRKNRAHDAKAEVQSFRFHE